MEGKAALQYILDNTRPETLALEPDLGWMEVGGGDCAWYLATYRDRCPVIHLKDYYSSDNSKLGRVRDFVPARGGADRGHFEFRPTGYGVLNLPKLMPLCLSCEPTWFVMDHDLAYERDPLRGPEALPGLHPRPAQDAGVRPGNAQAARSSNLELRAAEMGGKIPEMGRGRGGRMRIHDFREIGNRLYAVRKRLGLTQMEVAERAGLSLRTYADIERGTVNMRVDTALRLLEVYLKSLD